MKLSKNTIQALAVSWELHGGSPPSESVLGMIIKTLEPYGDDKIMKSLEVCSREVRGRLTPADIISRIDDGRPRASEAWAMLPASEADSAMWTEEMQRAYGVVAGMSDHVAARMGFIAAYERECARAHGTPVKWSFTAGTDEHHRETVLLDARAKGLLSADRVELLAPHLPVEPSGDVKRLVASVINRVEG